MSETDLSAQQPAELWVPRTQEEDYSKEDFELRMQMVAGATGARYRRSGATLERMGQAEVDTISGESGSGKSTLQKIVNPELGINRALSFTTRAPRMENGEMEEDGVQYDFLLRRQAYRKAIDGDIAQFKIVHGNLYGSLASSYEPGRNTIDVVPETGQEMRRLPFVRVMNICVILPSPEVSTQRILGRGHLPPDELKKRQDQSIESHQQLLDDAENFIWITNDDLEVAVEDYRYALTYRELPKGRQIMTQNVAAAILKHHLGDRVS